ncbi:MAG: TetR/AcrR family transcriptional regulator [Thermoleophilaceae bacterium]
MGEPAVAERALRADAQRNLESILEAAAATFADKGLDASVADIARRAGVGQATIFRRFETKDDLIAAVMEQRLGLLIEAADGASRRKRAWDGLREFMLAATELHARDRAVLQSMAERLKAEERMPDHVADLKAQLLSEVGALVERAKTEGDLRKDVAAQDIPVLICGAAQSGAMMPGAGDDVWKRYLQISLDGLRADCRGRLKPCV